jgi:hopanoid-associated phosphorylase
MSSRGAVIAVTSLSLEARIALGAGVSVICSHASQLVDALEAAIARGAAGIISFGVAGGLAPHLAAGDWVIGTAVRMRDECYPVDQRWARRLVELLRDAEQGDIAGADAPIAKSSEKRYLHAQTGALAVDMESHIAGRVAARHGIPFSICRTVIDAAHRDLPPAAVVGLHPDGTPDVRAVSRSVVQLPAQLPALIRTAVDAGIARDALRRGRRLLGAGLGCPYFTPDAPVLPNEFGAELIGLTRPHPGRPETA